VTESDPPLGIQLASSAVDDLIVASGLLRQEGRMNGGQLRTWLAVTEAFVAMIEEMEK